MPTAAMSIAIVDDDPSVRKALVQLLKASSFDAYAYGSAREFLDSLHVRTPNCLLLDLYMPELSGVELQHRLRSDNIIIPTIIMTGHNEMGLRQRCADAGAAAFLMKPLSENTLIESIKKAMHEHSNL